MPKKQNQDTFIILNWIAQSWRLEVPRSAVDKLETHENQQCNSGPKTSRLEMQEEPILSLNLNAGKI